MPLPRIERRAAQLLFKLPPKLFEVATGGRARPVEGRTLDPAVRAAIALHEVRGAPALETLSPAEARREFARQSEAFRGPPAPVDAVEDHRAPGPAGPIPVRVYRAFDAGAPSPAIVYYHGGGGVIGSVDSHDGTCRFLAAESGCAVVSVDYRLAPESPYPAGLDDAVAAYRWVAEIADQLGLDPERLAVGGDSFGGNLATTVARRTRGEPAAPVFQLLIYPGVDLTRSMPSHRTFAEGYLLSESLVNWFARHYLPDPDIARDPWASPILADDLAGLPPAMIATAGFDPLRDEGRAYADRLEAAGVFVRYHCFDSLVHGFLGATGTVAAATRAARACAVAIRDTLRAS